MAASVRTVNTYTVSASPTSAAEAVIATLGGVLSLRSGQVFKLHAWVAMTPEASATTLVLKIRRDSLTGTTVVTSPTFAGGDIVAGLLASWDVYGSDQATDVGGATYVLTATLANAAGTSTVSAVMLEARVD